MGIAYNTSIVSDGLVFALDAANSRCYGGSGLTINGLVGGIGGTLVNGVGFSSFNSGYFSFDGTNDYIQVPLSVSSGGSFSLNLKFKLNTLLSDMRLVGAVSGNTDQFTVSVEAGVLRWWMSNSWRNTIFSPTINTFYDMFLVYDGANLRLFINGNYITVDNGNAYFDNLGIANPFVLLYGSYLSGLIYGFQFYNKALTAQEIRQNYNATKKRYI